MVTNSTLCLVSNIQTSATKKECVLPLHSLPSLGLRRCRLLALSMVMQPHWCSRSTFSFSFCSALCTHMLEWEKSAPGGETTQTTAVKLTPTRRHINICAAWHPYQFCFCRGCNIVTANVLRGSVLVLSLTHKITREGFERIPILLMMFDVFKPLRPKTEYLRNQRKLNSLTHVMLIIYTQHDSDRTFILQYDLFII